MNDEHLSDLLIQALELPRSTWSAALVASLVRSEGAKRRYRTACHTPREAAHGAARRPRRLGLLPEARALAERAVAEFTADEERNPTLGVLQAAPKAGSAGPPSNSRHSGG